MTNVSVIIPNYNKEKTLRACLESVYAQTSPPSEVIVVDDRSRDRSREIAAEFPCTVIEQPTNQGPSAARNTGARAATGEVLFFLDSDIALSPGAIENALAILAEHPDYGVVQGIYDIRPLYRDSLLEEYKTLFEHYWRRSAAGVAVSTLFALTAIPRKIFEEVGGFDERLRDSEDIEFGTRLPARYVIWMSDRVVGRHDDVDRFWPYLAEHMRRAGTFGALVRGTADGGGEGGKRGKRGGRDHAAIIAMVGCFGSVATLPLVWLTGWLAIIPVGLLAAFVVADHDLLRFALRERGLPFAAYFTAMHALMHTTQLGGMAWGMMRGASR